MIDRAEEFWRPDPALLAGETVFVIGGGASLIGFDFERLRSRRVFAVNAAGYSAPWSDCLFFHDGSFGLRHRALIAEWAGLVVTTSAYAKGVMPDLVLRVESQERREFRRGAETVKRGRSSGHTAVSVAVAAGALRIILLGFDGKVTGGRSHFHQLYKAEDPGIYAKEFVPAWDGWRDAAERAGVTILNATPGSAIWEFPMVAIDDVLGVQA